VIGVVEVPFSERLRASRRRADRLVLISEKRYHRRHEALHVED